MFCIDISKDTDARYDAAITGVENHLGANIKRGFTNIGVKNFYGHKIHKTMVFETISIKENNNHILLTNLRFVQTPVLRMISTVVDLSYNVLDVEIDLGNIILYGGYEAFNMDLFEIIPISLQGNVEITLENVKAIGHIGIKKSGDIFYSTNFDLQYETGRIQTKYEYMASNGNKISKILRKDTLDETLVKSFHIDLLLKLQNSIRQKLNVVLEDFSISDAFTESEIIYSYSRRATALNGVINAFVDKLFNEINIDSQKSAGNGIIPVKDYKTSFEHKLGSVSINGEFFSSDGYVGNISTLKRRQSFSLYKENNLLYLFGNIGLDELKFGYNRYSAKLLFLEPVGSIKMTAGQNSVFFKIQTRAFAFGIIPDLSQITYDLKIDRLDNIQFQITGLHSTTLDWLVSGIGTWMIGTFKTDVVRLVELELKNQINSYIGRKNLKL